MIRAFALALALASAAGAGTLDGRQVTFATATWDDPAAPIFEGPTKTVTVGRGVEFGMESDVVVNGLSMVPVQVEIQPQRVEVTFPMGMGNFYVAPFNGYVLRFDTECALFAGWSVDREFTTLPIKDSDIFTDGGAIYINVSGMSYGPDEQLAVDLDVTDCPIS